jgi:hypothetical protein
MLSYVLLGIGPLVAGEDEIPARALVACQTQGTPYIYIL